MARGSWLLILGGVALLLSSCSGQIETPKTGLNNLEKGSTGPRRLSPHESFAADMNVEEKVSNACLHAWRRALGGEVDGAIEELKALDKEYPHMGTIKFMMGQVLDRAGRKQEAIPFFRDAVRESEFSSMHLFKLAEALRTTGDVNGAIPEYRKLLKQAPNFAPAKVGLAECLYKLDKRSAEARKLLGEVIAADPADKGALVLQKEMKSGD